MSRICAEDLNKLSINYLKRSGFLRNTVSGDITWTSAYGNIETKIHLESLMLHGHLQVSYTHIDSYSTAKMDYCIAFTSTPCNYGGKRYWFICPLAKNGVVCNKRVGVLYRYGQYFACRHCCNLAYESQSLSGHRKGRGRIVTCPELNALEEKVGYEFYRGKPTRKFRRYIEMSNRFMATL
ncbi:hypothetical protein BH11PAT2_BH11PAT2_04830 [soil metagenome]